MFTSKGQVGGTVQNLAEKEERVGERIAQEGRGQAAHAKDTAAGSGGGGTTGGSGN